MTWDFANRHGRLDINDFDKRSYTTGDGGLVQPTTDFNQFNGALLQVGGGDITGRATGSFVKSGSNPAAGVMGNWQVQATNIGQPAYSVAQGLPNKFSCCQSLFLQSNRAPAS